jgi:hypothetical protein
MMSDLNLGKVRAAQQTGRLTVGGVYKRTRFDDDDEKVQRAEVRFDDVAGVLELRLGVPAGNQSLWSKATACDPACCPVGRRRVSWAFQTSMNCLI